ncbi:unnamed protein product, partial [Aureobasidium pullulans]
HSGSGQDDRIFYGISCMQGWRISMEDAHATILDLQPLEGDDLKPAASDVRISFFGVYDGHGGDKVALYTGENLHKIIAKQEAFKNKDFEQALKDGFLAIDRAILSDMKRKSPDVPPLSASSPMTRSTSTVLGVKGRAKPLSFDHKPQNEGSSRSVAIARICAAGGFVDFGRVNGNLALSRAIGDFEFKKSADLPPEQQIVTAYPDVTVHDLSDDDEFIVLACDGEYSSSQAVIEFVRRGIAAKQELSAICENMMDNCLASSSETGGVGCDNMTISVVALLNGKSKDEWYQMIADRVANGDGPCAPPEYAEFKGPGVHHRFDNDSPDDYDLDHMNQHSRMSSGQPGRVILLGDGTEIMTDSGENDTDMFDQSDDEEKDLASQVSKGQDEGKNGSQEQAKQGTGETSTPAEPKMGGVRDSA